LRWHVGRWLGFIGRIMYVTCWSGCRTGRWSGCRTGQDVLKNCAMSTDEVRGHTGIVTSKPVPERCLRVRSSLHEGRRVGVGCLEEDSTCGVDGGNALLARASRKHPSSQSQTEGIPSAATLLSCVGLSVFCTRKCNSQGPLLDLALTQSLTWPPSALIDHFTRARGPAVLREEMYGTFGAHAFLSPVVCIRDPPLALAGLPA
jgi:hypothetical protein